MNLTCYHIRDDAPELVPARAARPWMDATASRLGLGRTFVCVAIFLFCLAFTQPVWAQRSSTAASGDCSNEKVDGFNVLPGPLAEIRTKFLTGPHGDSSSTGTDIIYGRILLELVLRHKLSQPSLAQCPMINAAVNAAPLELKFTFLGDVRPSDEEICTLNRCARMLSEVFQSTFVDRSEFAEVTTSLAQEFRRDHSVGIADRRLAAEDAGIEALRNAYPPGSRGRIIADFFAAMDFNSAEFDEFASWLATQRSALGRLVGAPKPTVSPSAVSEDDNCSPTAGVSIGEIKVDHHGWGNRAIILIKSEFKEVLGWGVRIENAPLRALCDPIQPNSGDLRDQAGGRIQCRVLLMGRDPWLILFGKRDSPEFAEMWQYAEQVVRALEEDKCHRADAQVLVVNFAQRR